MGTSQKQIEYSKRSEAARDCPRISREATELDMQLRTLPEGAEKAKMVQTYGQLVLKREYICGMQRRQETALDQVQIEITATPNLPVQVLTVGRYLDSILKGLLVEYVNQLPNIHNRDMHGVKMIIEFDQRLQALNLKITSPLDTTVFKNIRLPAWIRQILPLHHHQPGRAGLQGSSWRAPLWQVHPRAWTRAHLRQEDLQLPTGRLLPHGRC